MSQKKYKVTLTRDEENLLHDIINRGKHSAQKRKRAQALLLTHEGYTDEMTADRVGMHRRGIEEQRQRFVEEGFETALERKPRGHRPWALSREDEARLITLVCGPAPEGCSRWTLKLLEDTWVTLEHTDTETVSRETIRRTLSLGKTGNGVFPRKRMPSSQPEWRIFLRYIPRNGTETGRWSAWTNTRSGCQENHSLVMDNLNTHSITSLYETFPPDDAKRIKDHLQIHYTPKHDSWLNMAEIELNVINNHGLSPRIPTIERIREETAAWNRMRNKKACKINWRFTTADARIKLKRLYPQFE
jgi:transposase